MRSKTRKRRGGMDHEAPPPYSPPRPPPGYRRTPPPAAPAAAARSPPPLTTREWSKLKGILRLRPIAFDIRTPTTIVFNSSLPENNMAVLRMQFPREQLPSTVNASPEVNDSIVAEDRTNGNKYLLGTVVSKNPLKIRTPPQYDPPPAPAARLELNNDNFKILVINEQRPRPPVGGGTKKRKASKGKTQKRKGGKKNQRKRRTRRGGGTNGKKVRFYLGEKEEGEKSLGEIRDETKKKSIPKQRKLPVTPGKVAPLTSRVSPAPTLFNAPLTSEERLEKEKAKVARRQNRAKWWRLQAKNEYDELLRQIDEDEIPLPTTPEERLQLKLKVHNARRKAYPAS